MVAIAPIWVAEGVLLYEQGLAHARCGVFEQYAIFFCYELGTRGQIVACLTDICPIDDTGRYLGRTFLVYEFCQLPRFSR
jgi:hypothetical protein